MKIFIAADHRGIEAKQNILNYLKKHGYDVSDSNEGPSNPEDDYPLVAKKLINQMLGASDQNVRGILLCGSGQGVCMMANRFKGIRALLGYDKAGVVSARNDDDANVLCMPASLDESLQTELTELFLTTDFAAAPRFIRRIKEMDEV